MRPSRVVLIGWGVLIAALLVVELAEITHLFTLPIQTAIENVTALFFALVFTTILALVGAVFIGIYASARILSPTGFTPFEEEMLQMRSEVRDLTAAVQRLEANRSAETEVPVSPKERP
ncbi:MAG: hypothetical protein WB789_03330 [Thermoplasmata archaeon]